MKDQLKTGKADDSRLHGLVVRLVVQRKEAREAKAALVAKAAEVGRCDGNNFESGPCYLSYSKPEDMCGVCAAKQPLWEDWQRKSRMASSALRAVITEGKRLLKHNTEWSQPTGDTRPRKP